jgi:(p)ppGpp synthase/HD superfamily hydrolase
MAPGRVTSPPNISGVATMTYAQTNVQLYNELRLLKWPDDDLRHVQAAYHLAMRVVAGHYRPNEKPFVAHLVGVASILASRGAPSTVVCAGLVHAVYNHGEFGDGSRGPSEDKKRQVRRAVGAASEELVARYTAFPWSLARLEALAARAADLPDVDAAVALMKLADTLEECHESGMHYAPQQSWPDASRGAWLDAAARLARALRHPSLAAELAAARGAGGDRVPEFLQTDHETSFAVAPMSHGVRTTVLLGQLYRRMRDQVLPARPLGRKAA